MRVTLRPFTEDLLGLVQPWFDRLVQELPDDSPVLDSHTHVGDRDSSGITATTEELLAAVESARCRALVFSMSEPDGYRAANAACIDAARRSEGRLVALARVVPDEVDQLEEWLDAGAAGVKLHLSSDEFGLDDPRLERVFATADERRLPVVVHAGPEVDSLARTALATCERWPGLRMVLAHCALSDRDGVDQPPRRPGADAARAGAGGAAGGRAARLRRAHGRPGRPGAGGGAPPARPPRVAPRAPAAAQQLHARVGPRLCRSCRGTHPGRTTALKVSGALVRHRRTTDLHR